MVARAFCLLLTIGFARCVVAKKREGVLSPIFDEHLGSSHRLRPPTLSSLRADVHKTSLLKADPTLSSIANMQAVFDAADGDDNGILSVEELDMLLGKQSASAAVTVLMSDDRLLRRPSVSTADEDNKAEYLFCTVFTNALFARSRGYRFVFVPVMSAYDRHPSWAKIKIVRKLLPETSVVLFVDSDAFVRDFSSWVETLLPPTSTDTLMVISREVSQRVCHGCIDRFNCGIWLMRNSTRTLQMLDEWYVTPLESTAHEHNCMHRKKSCALWYKNTKLCR
jgi:hypothetical protein